MLISQGQQLNQDEGHVESENYTVIVIQHKNAYCSFKLKPHYYTLFISRDYNHYTVNDDYYVIIIMAFTDSTRSDILPTTHS